MRVGEIIRRQRRALHLTQEELAERSGIHKITICRIERERDEDRIYLRTARLLAGALDLTVGDLVEERVYDATRNHSRD